MNSFFPRRPRSRSGSTIRDHRYHCVDCSVQSIAGPRGTARDRSQQLAFSGPPVGQQQCSSARDRVRNTLRSIRSPFRDLIGGGLFLRRGPKPEVLPTRPVPGFGPGTPLASRKQGARLYLASAIARVGLANRLRANDPERFGDPREASPREGASKPCASWGRRTWLETDSAPASFARAVPGCSPALSGGKQICVFGERGPFVRVLPRSPKHEVRRRAVSSRCRAGLAPHASGAPFIGWCRFESDAWGTWLSLSPSGPVDCVERVPEAGRHLPDSRNAHE